MSTSTATDELAAFCINELSYEDLPDDVVLRAKEFLMDSVGIAICAADYDSSDAVHRAVESLNPSDGTSTVWATGEQYSAEYAAFLNGTFVHTPEIDDTHSEGVIHPAASVIPAAVAVGEREGASGKAVVTGIVGGYEVAVRLAVALPARDHAEKGFHPTATCGVFGATAAAAITAGLSAEELTNAFGVNISQTAGSRQWKENSAWTKRIHPGMAAKNAILATALAANGFNGSADALNGHDGFLNVYGKNPDASRLTDTLGDEYKITESGIKPFSCCRYFHTPIDVTLEAVTEHDITPDEITEIHLYGSKPVLDLTQPEDRKKRPSNLVDAQFSPYYAVAVAITDRAALVDQYDPERFTYPEIQSLIDKTTVHEDESMTARHPKEWPARIEITTERDTFTAEASLPPGDPDKRLSTEELAEKFRTITALSPDTQNEIIDTILTIDDASLDGFSAAFQTQQPLAR